MVLFLTQINLFFVFTQYLEGESLQWLNIQLVLVFVVCEKYYNISQRNQIGSLLLDDFLKGIIQFGTQIWGR